MTDKIISLEAYKKSKAPPAPVVAIATERPVGNFVREWRQSRGWTTTHLAMRLGCATHHLQAVETGRREMKLKFAMELSRAFGCGPGDLFNPPPSESASG